MKKISFTDHLHHRFDNYMSKGTIALIGVLTSGVGCNTFTVIVY